MDGAVDLNDGRNMNCPRCAGHSIDCIKDTNDTGLVAIAFVFIDPVTAGERFGLSATTRDLLVQGRLVLLELNDQMRACVVGRLEGFF